MYRTSPRPWKTSYRFGPAVSFAFSAGILTWVQLAPPSVVRTASDHRPTAIPFEASEKYTENNGWSTVVSERCSFHVSPPSAVCRITPQWPAAQPSLSPAKLNEVSITRVGTSRAWRHDLPWSSDSSTV